MCRGTVKCLWKCISPVTLRSELPYSCSLWYDPIIDSHFLYGKQAADSVIFFAPMSISFFEELLWRELRKVLGGNVAWQWCNWIGSSSIARLPHINKWSHPRSVNISKLRRVRNTHESEGQYLRVPVCNRYAKCHLPQSSWQLSESVTHIATRTFGLDVCFWCV